MQCFRLMGLPDKIIAFDELPEDLVKDFELVRADGFPKYWKNWMGEREIVHKIPSELNPVTGVRKTFDPFVEKDSYFYLVDWSLKPIAEKWRKVEEYVRQRVSPDFRLTDKLEDMAKPLAPDKTSGITLEPDEVVIIPLPKVGESKIEIAIEHQSFKCDEPGCLAEFSGKQAVRMHRMKKHPKVMTTV